MNPQLPSSDALQWVADVLQFWLHETPREAWFKSTPEQDRAIAERFGGLHAELHDRPPDPDELDAETALATLIVLDQFSRNMFRGTPKAFASDATARAIATAAVDAGLDRQLPPEARIFLYLPFEHSEDIADQDRSVALFASLGLAKYEPYAKSHRDIIARFGRFPHRNAILGRPSTPEELAFLREPGSAF
ncbi:MAG: DUF924 family protein [Hyphomicrobiaceae bacterium]